MNLRDRWALLWIRVTVCWRHGHQPRSSYPDDYCRNCGKPNS